MTTRKLGTTELLAAVYTRLTTDGLTSGYSTYNYVPDNATLPYVVMGRPIGVRSASFSSQDQAGEENTILIHVWSDYKGDKECSDMMDNIIQAITGSALSISGYTQLLGLLEFAEIIPDSDERDYNIEPALRRRHGVIRIAFHMA